MKKIKRQLRLAERWLSDFLRYPAHTFAHADKNSATFKYEISLKQAIQNNQGIENKLFNLRLAASKINEVIIRPGQTFSFWRIIGSPDQHYQKSRAIIGGKLVEDNGGGLCQICSAIYHISLIAGLEIVERHSHSIDIYSDTTRFTPLGTDATIVYGYKDLRIRNNKPDAIGFSLLISDETLTIFLKSNSPLGEITLCYTSYRKNGHKVAQIRDTKGNTLSTSKYLEPD